MVVVDATGVTVAVDAAGVAVLVACWVGVVLVVVESAGVAVTLDDDLATFVVTVGVSDEVACVSFVDVPPAGWSATDDVPAGLNDADWSELVDDLGELVADWSELAGVAAACDVESCAGGVAETLV